MSISRLIKATLGSYIIAFFLVACSQAPPPLFEKMPANSTNIEFENEVKGSDKFNIFSYRNFYNGGGVAIGDINNDGLSDIYFTGNSVPNKLYLNLGNFKFKDITESAGVGGKHAWSTGTVMVDINSDGLLDIYVCNAGFVKGDNRENELFINTGDLHFVEKAGAYGLNDSSYSTQASFFDYDMDGDLDAYILNNSFMPVNTLNYNNNRELYAEDWPVRDFLKGGGDKLLRNDDGKFVDVTRQSGIYGSLIGFGLGVNVADVNNDHYPDIYVSNDFYERDYLYINNRDGTFTDSLESWMGHISLSSMGADIADINNDLRPDIFVTEMLPADEHRLKTQVLFEDYATYTLKKERGFYNQYMHNTLQLNWNDKKFMDIAWYAGVAATDWSWGALIFDVDNDGYKDLFVCNGTYLDVTDQDFIDYFANDVVQQMALTGKKEDMDQVMSKMPSRPQKDKFFLNQGDLTFRDVGDSLGVNQKSFSNGAAYGDLDNDGDLDLVINNLTQPAFVYRNNAKLNHSLTIQLADTTKNTFAVGAKIVVYTAGQSLSDYEMPSRGFQSSVDYKHVIGIGHNLSVDSLIVTWPDGAVSKITHLVIDSLNYITRQAYPGKYITEQSKPSNPLIKQIKAPFLPHVEDAYNDFNYEQLVIEKVSKEGPAGAIGDVNGDGYQDVFIGNAKRTQGQIYLQENGSFELSDQPVLQSDAIYEDVAAAFFDCDKDGDLDLFVGSGGNDAPLNSVQLQDRLYLNDGEGHFTDGKENLPHEGYNTSVVVPFDIDLDDDMDLFVGSRSVPHVYGVPPKSFIYENDGTGKFKDATKYFAVDFQRLGMVTDAKLVDVNGDGKKELVIIGEWMAPHIYEITGQRLREIPSNLNNLKGWWNKVAAVDMDNDGDQDLVLGNRGDNFYFTGDSVAPVKLWMWDFDNNGTVDKIITRTIDGKDMTVQLKDELFASISTLGKQDISHSKFANMAIQDLFPKQLLDKAMVKEGNWWHSIIAFNRGNGMFDVHILPKEVQLSSVHAIMAKDINNDHAPDLLLAGNDTEFLPQYSRLDASFGWSLINNGLGGWQILSPYQSGFFIDGNVKQFLPIRIEKDDYFIALLNNQKPILYKFLKIN